MRRFQPCSEAMKYSIAFCLAVYFTLLQVSAVECQRKLINIDYLGIGYDAIQGNPRSNLGDPGFRQSVFPLEYTKQTLTADDRYLIPDNTEAFQMTNCDYQTESEEVLDEKSYRKSLSVSNILFFKDNCGSVSVS